ncbi:MAG TPA: hypothetical protein DCY48_04960 [Candidatus Magasanikbacteria bacterium]|nr:MAG: hypothetical protein A3I74_03440 [Candidatus Magasanikbacteria bacterium RIFCSPLOWO2_02_FULL_47_16]OGH80259.1 MAG: hypothetical protein A3C10_03720 [Candidatus Magasanikbacteria bacterium RIFCSPHIGHO2_02_FULL_48_18]HAZ29089.1 hypothetical protein [Candidatus Magasanikbacteria bacterium]
MPFQKKRQRTHRRHFLFLGLFFSLFLFGLAVSYSVDTVFAQTDFGVSEVEQGISLNGTDIRIIIGKIIRVLLGLVGIVLLGIILYGGYLYMTSQGEEDKITRAKQTIINGVIGLVIILSALTIVQFLLKALTGGGGDGGGGCVGPDCPKTPFTCDPMIDPLCACELEEGFKKPSWCADTFYVKSITPSTPAAPPGTKMNNIRVRAIFSQPIGSIDANTIFHLEKNGQSYDLQTALKEKSYVAEGVYAGGDSCSFPEPLIHDLPWVDLLQVSGIDPGEEGYLVDSVSKTKTVPGEDLLPYMAQPMTMELTLQLDDPLPAGGGVERLIYKNGNTPNFMEYGFLFFAGGGGFCFISQYAINNPTTQNSPHVCDKKSSFVVGQPNQYIITWENNSLKMYNKAGQLIDESKEVPPPFVPSAAPWKIAEKMAGVDYTLFSFQSLPQGLSAAQVQQYFAEKSLGVSSDVCLPFDTNADYAIQINDTVTNAAGDVLENMDEEGVSYPLSASFLADQIYFDFVKPTIGDVFVNGMKVIGNAPLLLQKGSQYTLKTVVDDYAPNNFGGVSYALVHVSATGPNGPSLFQNYYVDGPVVSIGSSQPFPIDIVDYVWQTFTVGKTYWLVIAAHDIDGNETKKSIPFMVNGGSGECDQFGKPLPGVDPSLCPFTSGNDCTTDAQCPADEKCIDNTSGEFCSGTPKAECTCTEWPTITGVDPLDGASGNWVTILGAHFGDDAGQIRFGIDTNDDGEIVSQDGEGYAISGEIVSCNTDTWRDSWIIAEVPEDTVLPQSSQSGIQIERAASEKPAGIVAPMTDSTVDDHLPYVGMFEKNTVERPGLCGVTVLDENGVSTGQTAGTVNTPVLAEGSGFQNTQNESAIAFGNIPASVKTGDWSSENIKTTVPSIDTQGAESLAVGVVVTVGGENSNGVPFTVVKNTEDLQPVIESINPPTSTPKSYVTIFGKGFGTSGQVYLAEDQEAVLGCVQKKANNQTPTAADGCFEMGQQFPLGCSETWTNTQVIVEVPEVGFQEYALALINNSLFSTDGAKTFEVQNGAPKPSICSLTPKAGNSPILDINKKVKIVGKNFGSGSAITYFWTQGAVTTTPSTWLSATHNDWFDPNKDISELIPGFINPPLVAEDIPAWTDGEIQTLFPVKDASLGGYSMKKGPIQVQVDTEQSNWVMYEAADCRNAGQDLKNQYAAQYQCCETGGDVGQWKLKNALCAGGSREAGYVWRFSTGKIPVSPHVVEQCDVLNWNVAGVAVPFPSPVPWSGWEGGADACVNGTVAVQFTMPMDAASFNEETVKIYTCGSGEQSDCGDNPILIPFASLEEKGLEYIGGGQDILKIIKGDFSQGNLDPGVWYRVELLSGIQSAPQNLGPGKENVTIPLGKSAVLHCDPLNAEDTVYCFEFKTGSSCVLSSVGIEPPEKEVSYLGVLLGQAFANDDTANLKGLFTVNDVLTATKNDPNALFYYMLMGKSDKACNVLEVNGLGWQWATSDEAKATALVVQNIPNHDDFGNAIALENTTPGFVDITAVSNFSIKNNTAGIDTDFLDVGSNITEILNAIPSELTINLSNPSVSYFEPNCAEACINGGIMVQFDTYMDKTTYANGFAVFECANANCANLTNVTNLFVPLNPALQTNFILRATLNPGEMLKPNTYYKVALNEENTVGGQTVSPVAGIYDGQIGIMSAGSKNDLAKVGKQLPPTSWVFKTKDSTVPCTADGLNVLPNPFSAYVIGEKTLFTAQPKASPNECSKYGQLLNQWDYGYAWGTLNQNVASVTNFISPASLQPFCTKNCLPKGSVFTAKEAESLYLCGNGTQDPGEDCDWGMDPTDYCTESCLFTESKATAEGLVGSEPYSLFDPTKVGQSWCGDGQLTLGEACDIGISLEKAGATPWNSKINCTNTCVHTGTQPQAWLCEGSSSPLCKESASVCGNGYLEKGEECEVQSETQIKKWIVNGSGNFVETVVNASEEQCGASCLLQDVCGTALEQCDPTQDAGCLKDCTFAGSSLLYPEPSLCGNTIVDAGEYAMCEVSATGNTHGNNPLQLVTAVGNGAVDPVSFAQSTQIEATLDGWYTSTTPGVSITGLADYSLQCGFTEFQAPDDNDDYNNCVENPDNEFGVGKNSCCYPRPKRTSEYPQDGTGLADEPACPNTYIEVTFDGAIDENTLTVPGNFVITNGHEDKNFDCAAQGEADVTDMVQATFAYNDVGSEQSFFVKLWNHVKQFFAKLFGRDVLATEFANAVDDMSVWCSGSVTAVPKVAYTKNSDDKVVSSTVSLVINKLLQFDTVYAVMLRGGLGGIADVKGVGIKNPESGNTSRDDIWVFQTGNAVCKLAGVSIEPDSYLFDAPNTTSTFHAITNSQNNQQIVPISSVYDWEWDWGPKENELFTIPHPDSPDPDGKTDTIAIGSKTVQGEATGFVNATVVADAEVTNNHVGKVFSASTDLFAVFCEKPWPAKKSDGTWKPWSEADPSAFHVAMWYCSDAGAPGTALDDLPFLNVETTLATQDPLSIIKLGFFNNQNDDLVGLQIFKNPKRLSPIAWLKEYKGFQVGGFQAVEVDGYQAITDGSNYYINVLNKDDANNKWYSNIYLFSINTDAQASTKNVFTQIINSLTFNINIPDDPYCGDGTNVNIAQSLSCDSDLSCKDAVIQNVTEEQAGACMVDEGYAQVVVDGVSVGLNTITFVGDKGWIGTESGEVKILKTEDSGKTWAPITIPNLPGSGIIIIEDVLFLNENHGWLAGRVGTFMETTDGGTTWESIDTKRFITDPGTSLEAISFGDASTGWVAGTNGIILWTWDTGKTWQKQQPPKGKESVYFHGVFFFDRNYGWVVGSEGTILATTNGGKTWIVQNSNVDSELYGVHFSSKTNGWVVGDGGKLLFTNDGGKTWALKNTVDGLNAIQVKQLTFKDIFVSPDGQYVLALSEQRRLVETTDGGNTWHVIWNQGANAVMGKYLGLFAKDKDTIWVVGEKGLVLTNTLPPLSCSVNTDCSGFNTCLGYAPEIVETVPLTTCHNYRTKLKRDLSRLEDIRDVQEAMFQYYSMHGNVYPDLQAGTFIPYYTNSRWPSWVQTLSKEITFGMPNDPLNQWSECDPEDQQTCWESKTPAFHCPLQSSIYEYTFAPSNKKYAFHAPMEYFSNTDLKQFKEFTILGYADKQYIPGDINGDNVVNSEDQTCLNQLNLYVEGVQNGIIPASLSPYQWDGTKDCLSVSVEEADLNCDGIINVSDVSFLGLSLIPNNPAQDSNNNGFHDNCEGQAYMTSFYTTAQACQPGTFMSPFAGVCGDGNLNQGEECESPNSTVYVAGGNCAFSEAYIGLCGADCAWAESPSCKPIAECGNSKVELGEGCDDGNTASLDGCSAICQFEQSKCGDGKYFNNVGLLCEKLSAAPAFVLPANNNTYTRMQCDANFEQWLLQCFTGLNSKVDCQNAFTYLNTKSFAFNNYSIAKVFSALFDGLLGSFGDDNDFGFSIYPEECTKFTGRCFKDPGILCDKSIDCENVPVATKLLSIENLTKAANNQSFNEQTYIDSLFTPTVEDKGSCVKNVSSGPTYHTIKELSCSWDCTSYGGYCGDGKVNAQYEACDDGNDTALDGCTPACQKENVACKAQNPYLKEVKNAAANTTWIYLGKGDYDAPTSFQGTPISACVSETTGTDICRAYGLGCLGFVVGVDPPEGPQYCPQNLTDKTAAQDQSLKSVALICDGIYAGAAQGTQSETGCGNGTLDEGEQCDLGSANGKECTPGYNLECTYCTKECTEITKPATGYCGDAKVNTGSSEQCDMVAATGQVVQKKVGNLASPITCESLYTDDGDATTDPKYGYGSFACENQCLNLVSGCVLCGEATTGKKAQWSVMNVMLGNSVQMGDEWRKKMKLSLYKVGPDGANKKKIGSEKDMPAAFMDYNTFSGSPLIEGSALCSAAYKTTFSSVANSSYFPYPLNVSGADIKNEFLLSPATPPNTYRVVVRWGNSFGKNDILPHVYHDPATGPQIKSGSYPTVNPLAASQNFCDTIKQTTSNAIKYWYPDGCSGYGGSIFVHPYGQIGQINAQSFTINTNPLNNGDKLGFFVKNITHSIFEDQNNTSFIVELYKPKSFTNADDPLSAMYLPDQVFPITEAKGTSTNKNAEYWHVFNLVKDGNGDIKIESQQKIRTCFCDVQNAVNPGSCALTGTDQCPNSGGLQ